MAHEIKICIAVHRQSYTMPSCHPLSTLKKFVIFALDNILKNTSQNWRNKKNCEHVNLQSLITVNFLVSTFFCTEEIVLTYAGSFFCIQRETTVKVRKYVHHGSKFLCVLKWHSYIYLSCPPHPTTNSETTNPEFWQKF